MSADKPVKTSVSISEEQREVLRTLADLRDSTIERTMFLAVERYADSMANNLRDAKAFNALKPLLHAARAELDARTYRTAGRSEHMRRINNERRKIAKMQRANPSYNPPPRRRPNPAHYSSGVYGNVIDETREVSSLAQRRMVGPDVDSFTPILRI